MEGRLGRILGSVGLSATREDVDHHILGTYRARSSEEERRAITPDEAFRMTDRRNSHLPKWYTLEYHQERIDYFVDTGVLRKVSIKDRNGRELKDNIGNFLIGYELIPQPIPAKTTSDIMTQVVWQQE